jgi:hypothetical protein
MENDSGYFVRGARAESDDVVEMGAIGTLRLADPNSLPLGLLTPSAESSFQKRASRLILL